MDFHSLNGGLIRDIKATQETIPNTIQCVNECIYLCTTVLNIFRKSVTQNGFESIEAEIRFFKHIKQIPASQLLYFTFVRDFELHFPRINKEEQLHYCKRQLVMLNQFYLEYFDFCEYMEAELTYFDEQYFTRKYLFSLPLLPSKGYFHNPDFNTARDVLLSEYKAYHLFGKYVEQRLLATEHKVPLGLERSSQSNNLQWTGTKSALTELIYALYYSNVFNHGKVEIKEIVLAFQEALHFDLGDVYKTYSEIKSRKLRRTKFLEELAVSLRSQMEASDE